MSDATQLDKTAGTVGCAHCRGLGASVACVVCGRPVCPACAAPASCPEPVARQLRLGIGRRLWDVDDAGRFGIMCSWSGRRRWLHDLAAQRSVRELPRDAEGVVLPRLGPEGLLLWTQSTLSYSVSALMRGSARDPALGEPIDHFPFGVEITVGDDGEHVALRTGSHVDVRSVVGGSVVRSFCEAHDVHSVALSAQHDLLAVGVWQQVRLLRLSRQEELGTLRIGDGDVAAIEVGGSRLAAITEAGHCRVVQIDGAASLSAWRTVFEAKLPISAALSLAYGDTPLRRRVRASLDHGWLRRRAFPT